MNRSDFLKFALLGLSSAMIVSAPLSAQSSDDDSGDESSCSGKQGCHSETAPPKRHPSS